MLAFRVELSMSALVDERNNGTMLNPEGEIRDRSSFGEMFEVMHDGKCLINSIQLEQIDLGQIAYHLLVFAQSLPHLTLRTSLHLL